MNIQHRKTAYLTFDDGPSEHTRIKLDYLQERGINAIWFCLGENLKQYTNEAVYAVQQGHVLGNHSYNHPKFSELGWQEAREQIERTDQWLQEVYSQAGVEWIVKTFRFPYLDDGSSNTDPDFFQNIQQLLRDKAIDSRALKASITNGSARPGMIAPWTYAVPTTRWTGAWLTAMSTRVITTCQAC